MNDFYMESEIKDRERIVRERQSRPQAAEGGWFLEPVLGFIVCIICLPRRVLLRLGGKRAPAPTAPQREARPVSR